jgi:hypothetical protein
MITISAATSQSQALTTACDGGALETAAENVEASDIVRARVRLLYRRVLKPRASGHNAPR